MWLAQCKSPVEADFLEISVVPQQLLVIYQQEESDVLYISSLLNPC